MLVGSGLGLVYAPCAGPILAGVITVSASQSFSGGRLAVALAYGAGSAAVLYVLMLGGRRLTSRLASRSGRFQMATGAVMVAVAGLMLFSLDTRFETSIASDLPAFLVDPSRSLEDSNAAQSRLASLRASHNATKEAGVAEARRAAPLPVLGAAPTSPAPSAGSTPRVAARSRSPACAAASCSSTSGLTAASTAYARCPT